MLTPHSRILARPPHVSAIRALIAFGVAGGTGLGFGVWGLIHPEVPYLSLKTINTAVIASGVSGLALATKYGLLFAQRRLEFSWLSKKRTFVAIDNKFPYISKRGERVAPWPWRERALVSPLLAPVRPILADLAKRAWHLASFAPSRHPELDAPRASQDWQVEWVPYRTKRVQVVDAVTGATKVVFVKEPIRDDRLQAFARRADWLRGTFPRRYEVVMTWWRATWSQATDPLSDASPCYIEYLQGANLACEPTWWSRRLGPQIDLVPFTELQALLRELSKTEQINVTQPPALPPRPVFDDLWWGKGWAIERSHVERMYALRLHDRKEAGLDQDDPGDSRPYATGIKDEMLVFRPMRDSKQHILIVGGTGVGKTTVFQLLTRQIINSGAPFWIIDPKGDLDWVNQTAAGMREEGRAHQFRYFNLVLPSNQNVCKLNPFGHYLFTSHLGNRTASILTQATDPFFTEKAKELALVFHDTCDAAMNTLRLLARDPQTGAMPGRYSAEVPRVLLVIQYMASNPGVDRSTADAAVTRILKLIAELQRTKNSNHVWPDGDRATVNLAQLPEFAPKYWNPSLSHCATALEVIEHFGVAAMKVAAFHVGLDMPAALLAPPPARPGAAPGGFRPPAPQNVVNPFLDPQFIRSASPELITGKAPYGVQVPPVNFFQLYRMAGTHPLETRLERHLPMEGSMMKWKAIYDYYVPPRAKDDILVETTLKILRERIITLQAMAAQGKESFLEHAATFKAALQRFQGPVRRIISAQEPDADFQTVYDHNLGVYVSLGSMIDKDGAGGTAKLLMSEALGFCGELYHYNKGKPKKTWFIITDEIGRIINDDHIEAAAQIRGAGCAMGVAAQSRADFRARLGNTHQAEQFLNNVSTIAQLRAPGAAEAKEVAESYGKETIRVADDSVQISPAHGGSGNELIKDFSANHSLSFRNQEVERVSANFARSLPMGQLILDAMGGTTYLVQIPVLPETEVNLKEEYGTLDDERDEQQAKDLGERIRSEIADIVAKGIGASLFPGADTANTPIAGGSSAGATPLSAPAPLPAPAAASVSSVMPPPGPMPATVLPTTLSSDAASAAAPSLPLPGALPKANSLPLPGALLQATPTAKTSATPVTRSEIEIPTRTPPASAPPLRTESIRPASPPSTESGTLRQPMSRLPLPPRPPKTPGGDAALPMPMRPTATGQTPQAALPTKPTATPVTAQSGESTTVSPAKQPGGAPDGSTVAFPGMHSGTLRLPSERTQLDTDELGSGSPFGDAE